MRMPHRDLLRPALRLGAALSLGLAFALPACGDGGGGGPKTCELGTDCPLPESCIAGVCRLECRRDADCLDGQTCDPVDFICLGGDACRSGNCLPAEQDLSFIGGGRQADSGLTFIDQGAATGGSQAQDAAPAEPDAHRPPPADGGAPPPPPADAGPVPLGNGDYGDRCTCAADCRSGFCVENKLRGARTCTERCDVDNDCPGVDTCLMAQVRPGGGDACPPVDLGLEPGQIVGVCAPNETSFPCTDGAQCTSGLCIALQPPVPWADPADICSTLCQSDEKCPSGYTCQAVPGLANGQRACAPDLVGVAQCDTFETCGGVCPVANGVNEADVALCVKLAENQPGYCTCTCAHASDCPHGYACQRALEIGNDPLRPGTCVPLAGLVCPHEAMGVPPVPMECMSLQCMGGEADQPFYSRCTSTCVDDRDCPAAYRCLAVDDGMAGPDPQVCVPR